MNLRNLVGKTAIRTAEAFNPEPFSPVHFVFDFPVLSPKPGSTRKYMDEPVKIINVKEDQVVIEEHGERKLLERRYIDNHWIDYDKFLHPEKEEKEKAEKLMKEFEVAAKPIKRCILRDETEKLRADLSDRISMDNIQIFRGELGEPIQNICCRCGAEVEEEMKG